MRTIIGVAPLLAFLVASVPAQEKSPDELVKATLRADAEAVAAGKSFLLAVEVEIEAGWHIYWKNPGSSGVPTSFEIKAPAGFLVDPVLFPRPKVMGEGEDVLYGYEKRAVFLVPVSRGLSKLEGRIEVTMPFLVCNPEVCLSGTQKLSLDLPGTLDAAAGKRIADAKARLSRPWSSMEGGSASIKDGALELGGPTGAFQSFVFAPLEVPGLRFGKTETVIDGGRFRMRIPLMLPAGDGRGMLKVEGLLLFGAREEDPSWEVSLEVPAGK